MVISAPDMLYIRIYHSYSLVIDNNVGPYESAENAEVDLEKNGWIKKNGGYVKDHPKGWEMTARITELGKLEDIGKRQ